MKKVEQNYLNKAISYSEFELQTSNFVENKSTSGNEQTDEKIQFTKLNLHRMGRLDKTIVLDAELSHLIKDFSHSITILVITESWCGDGAQQIPWLAKISELNSNLSLKILFRDENTNLMNNYLTNGNQSIPVTLFLDSKNYEITKLSSRPDELKHLIAEWSKEDIKKEEKLTRIHSWYAKNKGVAFQNEIKHIFQSLLFNEVQNKF